MNLSAISSNMFVQSTARQPEASEVRKSGADNDGDADDRQQAAKTSSVNLNGQITGRKINAIA